MNKIIKYIRGVERRGSRVQGYPQIHSDFKVSLGYMKPCLKNRKKNTTYSIHFSQYKFVRLHMLVSQYLALEITINVSKTATQ
jgi:hypothetical protein